MIHFYDFFLNVHICSLWMEGFIFFIVVVICFEATPSDTQKLLLALQFNITHHITLEIIEDTRD